MTASPRKVLVERVLDGFRRGDHDQILACPTNDPRRSRDATIAPILRRIWVMWASTVRSPMWRRSPMALLERPRDSAIEIGDRGGAALDLA